MSELQTYGIGQWFLRTVRDGKGYAIQREIYVLSLLENDSGGDHWNLICINDGYRWDESFSVAPDGLHHEVPVEVFEDWLGPSKDVFEAIDNPANKRK